MTYRISIDTGGTFTDVVVADAEGKLIVGKSLTTPERSFGGVYEGLKDAAHNGGLSVDTLLREATVMIYGTTRATNAIVTSQTAKTAALFTEGFPDILVYRQGGKLGPFNLHVDPAEPYIPRRLTFEISERVNSEGEVVTALDEAAAHATVASLKALDIEAVAVLSAVVDFQFGARGAYRRVDRRHPARPALHPVAPAQPDHPRISARLVDRHRRLAQAPDAEAFARIARRFGGGGLWRRAPHQHLVGRCCPCQ